MSVTLYGLPGSHPVRAVRLMLDHKGIEYRNIDLLPLMSRFVIAHVLRFPGDRVPAMKIDGRRIQGTTSIARELDRLAPAAPLFPADPDLRGRVEDAERWADAFQQVPRTIIWWALAHAPSSAQASFLAGARLGLPPEVLARTSAPILHAARRANNSYDPEVQRLLAGLPADLDRIDALIDEGVLGGENLYVADFDIGASLRLLASMQDLAPAIDARPCGRMATRVQPAPPGHIGPVFPAAWLEPLRATAGDGA